MANTLDLDEEWGPVDVVIALGETFEVKFADPEVRDIYRVGQMYDLLHRKVAFSAGRKCASALAFYQLRRALADEAPAAKLTPRSALAFLESHDLKRRWKMLEQSSGLRLPKLALAWDGIVRWPLIACALSIPVGLIGLVLTLYSEGLGEQVIGATPFTFVGGLVFAILGGIFGPRRLPDEARTLGSLAASIVPRNYGRLAQAGAPLNDALLWDIMLDVLCKESTLPREEITRDTYFLRSGMRKAA